GLGILRARTTRARGIAMNPRGQLGERLRATLPFALTQAQERVWGEIRTDMASPHPMHRLLQGDVGSGKTVVAALAVATAVAAGSGSRSSTNSTASASSSGRGSAPRASTPTCS